MFSFKTIYNSIKSYCNY